MGGLFRTIMSSVIKYSGKGYSMKSRFLHPSQKACLGAATGWKNFHVRARFKSGLQISCLGFYHKCKHETHHTESSVISPLTSPFTPSAHSQNEWLPPRQHPWHKERERERQKDRESERDVRFISCWFVCPTWLALG